MTEILRSDDPRAKDPRISEAKKSEIPERFQRGPFTSICKEGHTTEGRCARRKICSNNQVHRRRKRKIPSPICHRTPLSDKPTHGSL